MARSGTGATIVRSKQLNFDPGHGSASELAVLKNRTMPGGIERKQEPCIEPSTD